MDYKRIKKVHVIACQSYPSHSARRVWRCPAALHQQQKSLLAGPSEEFTMFCLGMWFEGKNKQVAFCRDSTFS